MYFIADVYLANPSALRTGFAGDAYNTGQQELLTDMSNRTNSVLSINGDSYCYNKKHTSGPLIRNGMQYRSNPLAADIAVLYTDGRLSAMTASEFYTAHIDPAAVAQTWTFGPRLLDENGQIPADYNTWSYIRQRHPRTAIGCAEPGHYYFLVADGRQKGYSNGLTLTELSQIFADLGCTSAYNLDGGHTTGMVFCGKLVNHPYKMNKPITDCISVCEPQ